MDGMLGKNFKVGSSHEQGFHSCQLVLYVEKWEGVGVASSSPLCGGSGVVVSSLLDDGDRVGLCQTVLRTC